MHGLHKRNVGVDRLFVQGLGIREEGNRTDGALDGIQQRQAGENPHGGFLFLLRQRLPAGKVIGDWDLFWQPEITGEALPYLEVLFIRDAIPVNGLNWLFMTRNVVIVLVRHAASLQY